MLLNFLQCTGRPPTKNSASRTKRAETEKPWPRLPASSSRPHHCLLGLAQPESGRGGGMRSGQTHQLCALSLKCQMGRATQEVAETLSRSHIPRFWN